MKHLSHFVQPGAKRLTTSGTFDNLLAFINPDKSIVIVAQNESNEATNISITIGNKTITPVLQANTFNTLLVK